MFGGAGGVGKGFSFSGIPTTTGATAAASNLFGGTTGGTAAGFNFGSPAPVAGTGVPAATGTNTGFNFGGPGSTPAGTPGSTGYNFGGTGTAAPAGTAGTGAFGLGQQPASTATPGFGGFGANPANIAAPATIAAPASIATPAGFNLTGVKTTPSTGLALGGGATPAAAPGSFTLGGAGTTGGFSLGAAGTTAIGAPAGVGLGTAGAPGGFSLTGAGSTNTAAAGGFGLGVAGMAPATGGLGSLLATPATAATAQPGMLSGLLATPASTAQTGLLSGLLAAPASTTTTGLTLGGGIQATATTAGAASGFKLGTAATTAAAPGLFLGGAGIGLGGTGLKLGTAATAQPTAATTTAGLGFGTAATTSATTGFGLGSTASTSGGIGLAPAASTAKVAGTRVPSRQMNYCQLEDQINKWMTELEEQERLFLQQATQVNAWDRLLVDNGEKISQLNGDMERVTVDQNKLEQELEFIKSQQRELEKLLDPMEKSLDQLPSISLKPHADLERENTYQLADNIDAQLKRMVQDLKEIIDHLNTSSSSQDISDPILQVTKILNAHMDSLQWIDTNTALLNRRVEDIGKQMESQRKDQERNFRLVYD